MQKYGTSGRFRRTTGGPVVFFISMAVVFVVAIGACLVALRRRGGSGEREALERGATEQGLAQGLGAANAKSQNSGPWS